MYTPYTEITNIVLRDPCLSLSCKGLYSMIYSYAGLPNFQLTLRHLEHTCSDSTYALRKAWRELKASGYLQHYYTTLKNGAFSHVYDIHQDLQLKAGTMRYAAAIDRPNGDLRPVRSLQARDYTTVANTVLRDNTLTLQIKGLYSILSYLFRIPNFSFRMKALAGLCQEKTKALASAWSKIKRCGLLKQHRHPSGAHNQFQYTYDLLTEPDISQPYFTNHRADGTITLSLVTQAVKTVLSKSRRMPNTAITVNQAVQTDSLQRQIEKALCALSKNKHMKINGQAVPVEARKQAVEALTPDILEAFKASFRMPEQVRAPIPYLASALYQYAQRISPAPPAPAPVSQDEIMWVLDVVSNRVQNAQTSNQTIATEDVHLAEQYRALNSKRMSMSAEAYAQECRILFENWKK